MTGIAYDEKSLTASYGGAEVFYSYTNAANIVVKLITNIHYLAQFGEPTAELYQTGDIAFSTFENGGSTYARCQTYVNNVLVDQADFNLGCPNVLKIDNRVVFDKAAISVYVNDLWVYTYAFTDAIWPDEAEIKLKVTGGNLTIAATSVEIADPREAVYIDYESTADSAIQSIIQQRPVQIFAESDRANTFTYSATRDTINAHHVISYDERTQDNSQLSSDGLVYYSDVGISNSALTAEKVGLVTRLYRLSELENGAIRATRRMQQIAIEQRKIITVTARLDPRLEIADIYHIDTVITGTNRHIQDEIIIETIAISLSDGSYGMSISGRRKM